MENFDFTAPAEVYASRGRGMSRWPMTYRRFDTGADAVRYAVETLPPEMLNGTVIEAGDERYEGRSIRGLYDSASYPLTRKRTAASA